MPYKSSNPTQAQIASSYLCIQGMAVFAGNGNLSMKKVPFQQKLEYVYVCNCLHTSKRSSQSLLREVGGDIQYIIYIYIYIILLYKCTIYLQKYVYSFLLLKNPLGQLEVKLRDGIQPTIRDSQVLVPVNVEPCHMNLRVHPNISQIHFREKGPITFLGVMLNTFSQARLGSDTSFIEIHELLAKLMGIAPYSSSAPKKPLKFLFIL